MKKIILSALALTAFTFTASAQTPDIKLGAKAGVNFANLNGAEEADMKTGFHIGAVAEIFINEKFSVQPEILYSTQGAKSSIKEEIMGEEFKYESTLKLDYLNIPIMAKYYVIDGLSIQAGPQIGFNIKAEQEDKFMGEKETTDIKDSVNSIDFGLNFGAGYELPMGLFFDARYNLGLTKVNKEGDGDDIKNGVFQISVGYKF